MHEIRFPLVLHSRPHWKSLQRFPRPLAVFKGPTFKGRERNERELRKGVERKGKGGMGTGEEVEEGCSPPNNFGVVPAMILTNS